jgi:hypothetical protein
MRARRTAVSEPPTRASWTLESETVGHSPSETLAYLAAVADFEDQQAEQARAVPEFVISPPRGRRRWWLG